jgi:PKD repeat protein
MSCNRWVTMLAAVAGALGSIACGDGAEPLAVEEPARPVVSIAVDPAHGVAPLEVSFAATIAGGVGPIELRWDFGDGFHLVDDQTVTHVYWKPGSYTTRLAATDALGRVAEAELAAPVVVDTDVTPSVRAFAEPDAGTVPLIVAFRAESAGGNGELAYRWDFGDRSDPSAAPAPLHAYRTVGLFEASVEVRDEDGDVAAARVTVEVLPENEWPTAVAQIVEGACAVPAITAVVLDASKSADAEGDELRFTWFFSERPQGSVAELEDVHASRARFVPDVVGSYAVRVVVSDGDHNSLSPELRVQAASTPAAVAAAAGDGQHARVGTATGPLVARLLNECGAGLEGTLAWLGDNAAVDQATTSTDAAGHAENRAVLGVAAGPASVWATYGALVAEFHLVADPGPPARIVQRRVLPVPVSSEGVEVQWDAFDELGNLASLEEVTLDLRLFGAPGTATHASFSPPGAAPDHERAVTTKDGTARARIYDTTAETAYLAAQAASHAGLAVEGSTVFFAEDFEAKHTVWSLDAVAESPFEIGAPTIGPQGAHGGTRVLATRLHEPVGSALTVAERLLDLGFPYLLESVRLRFWHWYDTGPDRPADAPTCSPVSALVTLDTLMFPPAGGYPGLPNCTYSSITGFSGRSDGWEEAVVPLDTLRDRLAFQLVRPTVEPGEGGLGWFVDDVIVEATTSPAGIVFLPGPPVTTDVHVVRDGVALGCAAELHVRVYDAFRNRVGAQETVAFASGGIVSMSDGWPRDGAFEGGTRDDGTIELSVASHYAGAATFEAWLPGVAGSASTATLVFAAEGSPCEP